MALSCQSLFESIAGEFGVGVGNEKFAAGFVNAVNLALDGLSLEADLATRHAHIRKTEASISTLDEEYSPILRAGVVFWLLRMGHLPSDPKMAKVVLDDARIEWKDAKAEYVVAEFNANQATDSWSAWGLGYVGTTDSSSTDTSDT